MAMVHASRGFLKPPSDMVRSEPWIIANLAGATLGTKVAVDWEGLAEDYALIRDKIAAVIPDFEGYNDRIRKPRGFICRIRRLRESGTPRLAKPISMFFPISKRISRIKTQPYCALRACGLMTSTTRRSTVSTIVTAASSVAGISCFLASGIWRSLALSKATCRCGNRARSCVPVRVTRTGCGEVNESAVVREGVVGRSDGGLA
jgi:hypothetical protein